MLHSLVRVLLYVCKVQRYSLFLKNIGMCYDGRNKAIFNYTLFSKWLTYDIHFIFIASVCEWLPKKFTFVHRDVFRKYECIKSVSKSLWH